MLRRRIGWRGGTAMKRWKVALSLAVVAAIAVPVLAGTWQLDPGRWVKDTESDNTFIGDRLRLTNCPGYRDDEDKDEWIRWAACQIDRDRLEKRWVNGGDWDPPPERVTSKHVVKNLAVAASAFGLMFALVMVPPVIARRYWQWLQT